jgi:autotransporter-associated beta strand protein
MAGLRGIAVSIALLAALACSKPAFAQAVGGHGGTGTGISGDGPGGAGGTATSPNAANGGASGYGGGGGGGGAVSTNTGLGGSGGTGGAEDTTNGGADGTVGGNGGNGGAYFSVNPGSTISTGGTGTAGGTGQDSSSSNFLGGGGGGGGAGGGGVLTTTNNGTETNNATISGGAGGNAGNGGDGSNSGGNGGSGGGGGDGFTFTGSNSKLVNNSTITGGAGGAAGNGGAGTGPGNGGNGGQGGAGVDFLQGHTLVNSGTITGGNGGAAGAGGIMNNSNYSFPNGHPGAGGSGGAGVSGPNLTIINSGSIAGGLANGGTGAQAAAIDLTSGTNRLTTNGAGSYTGAINIGSGTLTLDQTAADGATGSANYSTSFTGSGRLIVNTDSNTSVTLSSANSYGGGTTLSSGTLQLSNAGTLGATTGALSVSSGSTLDLGGTSQTTGTLTLTGGTIQDGVLSSSAFNTQSGTISAILSGGGALNQNGSGTTILSSANNYTGGTTISVGTLELSTFGTFGVSTGTLAVSGGTLDLGGTSRTTGALTLTDGTIQNGTLASSAFNTQSGTISAILAGGGALTQSGSGTTTLSGANTYSGGTTVSGGTLQLSGLGTLGATSGTLAVSSGGTLDFGSTSQTTGTLTLTGGTIQNGTLTSSAFNAQSGSISAILAGSGVLVKTGGGTLTMSGVNTYSGGTTISAGTLALSGTGSLGFGAFIDNGIFSIAGLTNGGISLSSLAGNGSVALGINALTLSNANGTFSGAVGGSGGLTLTGGTETLSGANGYSGGTSVSGGTLMLSGAGTLGATNGSSTVGSGGTLDLGSTTQTQASVNLNGGTIRNGSLNAAITSTGGTLNGIGGSASLITTSGTTTLLGASTYTGGTTVNGGVLDVLGTISDPTVNAGGTLTGTGAVGATQINAGGTFMPGNGTPGSSMTVNGNLAFQSGAIYLVQVSPASSSFATVNGAATLGGATVGAMFAQGSYVYKQYTILSTTGGVTGTFSPIPVTTNLPSGFVTTLSYAANDVFLNVDPELGGGGAKGNQQHTTNSIDGFFNAGGGLPPAFLNLFGLSGGALSSALTQLSGETATGAQQTTFAAMGEFMGMMTDPFMNRTGGTGTSGAIGYADGGRGGGRTSDAFAMFSKAPLAKVYNPRWSVWASGFGGSQTTDGSAATGANNMSSSIAGTAVGADYLLSPNTIAGFALAGGGTSFSVANGGSGHSDLFQAGAYLRHFNGPAYISAALAYGWQDITTSRTVTIAGIDQLRAAFDANAWSGRLEGGYRFVVPRLGGLGITPYAAAQFTTFDLPAYSEQALVGSSAFALNYAAKEVTDARSELGIRTDKSFALSNAILTLRGRLAWAHDYDPDRTIAATFQALPGASFVVNGAAQASDSALTTASLEMRWLNGWSAAATFEGEFSAVTSSYAGKGVVRYQW